MTRLPWTYPRIEDFVPGWPHPDSTQRRMRRHRRARNAGRREWLLAIGREGRAEMRLDPPCDYDEIPF